MQIATIVKQIVEVAAVNPEAQAIIVARIPDSQAALLREALNALSGIGQLPPVLLIAGDAALADSSVVGPTAGIFIGTNQIAELLKLTDAELKVWLNMIYRDLS